MSSNEKFDDARVEIAEKPKTPSTIEKSDTKKDGLESKVEPIGETSQGKLEGVTSDFFSVNESRLGYKSRLTLAIRKALAGLEREASSTSGLSVEKLRAEFVSLQSGRRHGFEELRVRSEYVTGDYRVFLIFFVSLARRRSGIN